MKEKNIDNQRYDINAAIQAKDYQELERVLARLGAQAKIVLNATTTGMPLHTAIQQGDIKAAELCLRYGAELEKAMQADGNLYDLYLVQKFTQILAIPVDLDTIEPIAQYTTQAQKLAGTFATGFMQEAITNYIQKQNINPTTMAQLKHIGDALFATAKSPVRIISCNFSNQTVYIALVGDLLILSNRGLAHSQLSKGVKLFRTKRVLDEKTIADLNTITSPAQFEQVLSNLVPLNDPIKEFSEIKTKKNIPQPFSNLKGLVAPVLYALGSNDALSEYKNFAAYLRTENFNMLLRAFANAQRYNLAAEQGLLADLLCLYAIKLILHQGDTEQQQLERGERFAKIIQALIEYKPTKDIIALLSRHMHAQHIDTAQTVAVTKAIEDAITTKVKQPQPSNAYITTTPDPMIFMPILPETKPSFFARVYEYVVYAIDYIRDFFVNIFTKPPTMEDPLIISIENIQCNDTALKQDIINALLARIIKNQELIKQIAAEKDPARKAALAQAAEYERISIDLEVQILEKTTDPQELQSALLDYINTRKEQVSRPVPSKKSWLPSQSKPLDEYTTLQTLEAKLRQRPEV